MAPKGPPVIYIYIYIYIYRYIYINVSVGVSSLRNRNRGFRNFDLETAKTLENTCNAAPVQHTKTYKQMISQCRDSWRCVVLFCDFSSHSEGNWFCFQVLLSAESYSAASMVCASTVTDTSTICELSPVLNHSVMTKYSGNQWQLEHSASKGLGACESHS